MVTGVIWEGGGVLVSVKKRSCRVTFIGSA
jgi:hypothetical protein